ncbi:MAG: hypothetical protein K6F51_15315 [Acetatifactor sp.]|nr:hypothetical protein [Acetatifactor sp.]
MEKHDHRVLKKTHNNKFMWIVIMCLFGFALNVICNILVTIIHAPLYLDTIGTIFTARLGGALQAFLWRSLPIWCLALAMLKPYILVSSTF